MNKLRVLSIIGIMLFVMFTFTSACSRELPYYVLEFDSDGGTEIDPIVVHEGDLIEAPKSPSRIGYIFKGWYTDPNFKYYFNFTRPINKPMRFYAKWEPQEYEIRFVDMDGYELRSRSYTYGDVLDNVIPPSAPYVEGYYFVGWSMPVPDIMPASSIIIFPVYVEENRFFVSNQIKTPFQVFF